MFPLSAFHQLLDVMLLVKLLMKNYLSKQGPNPLHTSDRNHLRPMLLDLSTQRHSATGLQKDERDTSTGSCLISAVVQAGSLVALYRPIYRQSELDAVARTNNL